MTLSQLIKKVKFFYVNSDITDANFPPQSIQETGWKIIRFDHFFSSEEALAEIKKQGCRPANIYELAYLQDEYGLKLEDYEWLLALGSSWKDVDGDHGVPYVFRRLDGDWDLDLDGFGGGWSGDNGVLVFTEKENAKEKLKCTCNFNEETAKDIGHYPDCPQKPQET